MLHRRLRLACPACACLVLVTAACGTPGSPNHTTTRTARYEVGGPVRSVVVDGAAGDVRVGRTESASVVVTETKRFGSAEPVTEHTLTDATLTLRQTVHDGARVSYEVAVPRGVAVEAVTSSGRITLVGLSGDVSAHTTGGSIEGRELTAGTVTAKADEDTIDLSFASPPARVDADGDTARVRLPAGVGYVVDATSNRGAVRVEVPQDAAAPYHVRVHTRSGDASVLRASRAPAPDGASVGRPGAPAPPRGTEGEHEMDAAAGGGRTRACTPM
ncbi:hypothetical protein ACFRCG_28485 [Embleya sp. NPDC056575]|uniref:hypothetical protein n=1 Tax=unclassified Embleya TaxID=2699296 RepID=UPI0036B23DDA